MSTKFYLEQEYFRTQFYREQYTLRIATPNFEILRELLDLPDPDGYSTGKLSAEELLQKIQRAEDELGLQGKEWERSYAPPPERLQGQKLRVMGTPELTQESLHLYLDTLKRIAKCAQAHNTNVKWD